ncbi:hypothetical protein N6H18_11045 [Reichenbachiella agarivorans]|uniref:LTXXQ motif family protein n=1 Tax=Reichenbachiella agarivorans TaxID=2979464 RepID=A0ABY6CK51_9BACT|nr:hypothetical protein [Reichenbachiella agarivorans]UXP30888.1 hypothetical protein N6H18_11045 [Reichenbachiella agarivorans]
MKTYFKSIIVVLGLTCLATAVQSQDQQALDKIESAKIALITERLGLTPDQAEKFWPLYNEYSAKRMELRQEYRRFRTDAEGRTLSEDESKKLLEKGQQLKERQLQIDKSYSERLNTVITNRQLLQLRTAEEDFRNMLLQRLEQRSNQIDRREMMQQRMDKRNNE